MARSPALIASLVASMAFMGAAAARAADANRRLTSTLPEGESEEEALQRAVTHAAAADAARSRNGPSFDPMPFVETRQIRRARERAERKAARQTIERYK